MVLNPPGLNVIFRSYYRFGIIFFLLILAGCSVEKNTSMSRNFHNLISRYNIYFNGKESFKKGIKKLERNYKDDFSGLLPVFLYGDESVAQSVTPEMDRAIEKASKVITLHSITAKPDYKGKELSDREQTFYDQDEYNNWVDNSYLLMGKAQFIKHEFNTALQTLKYANESALDDDVKYEAWIWMARTYNEQGAYREAQRLLTILEEDAEFPSNLLFDRHTTQADFFLKQYQYASSIPYLERALNLARSKKYKARLNFIIAQCYEELGETTQAYRYYKKVVKLNPTYEMAFNARINQAESFDVTVENASEIRKILRKMLRDEKNTEYQDQIYYAYGQVSLKEGKEADAIDYFKRSAAVSISNNNQKAVSYLSIADLYFNNDQYLPAQAYYDSAVRLINNDYPDYDMITTKSRSLTRLVGHVTTVQREDSLQIVAAMNPEQQQALINDLIQQAREEERQREENQNLASYNPSSYYETERQIRQELSRSGNWYFYNQAVLGFGRTEFKQRWGDRPLEDNWRRQNKSVSEMNLNQIRDGEQGFTPGDSASAEIDAFSPAFYLKNLPVNDSLMAISNEKIEEALFNMGVVYAEELQDYEKAIEAFESLISRFPETRHLLSAYRFLYDLYSTSGNTTLADKYKDRIINAFPESEFAQILSDPDYVRKRNQEEQEIYRIYESTYQRFLARQYSQTINDCDSAINQYKDHELIPKFRLLRAYAIAESTNNIREYKAALEEVIENAPDGVEKQRASELIAYYREEIPEIRIEDEQKESLEIYVESMAQPHIVIIVSANQGMDFNQLIFNIINFNLDIYPQSEFSTSQKDWDEQNTITMVTGTGDGLAALRYMEQMLQNEGVQEELSKNTSTAFVISTSNFETLNEHKSISVYLKFYEKYYINQEVPE